MSMTLGELKAAVMSTIGNEYTADIVRYLNKGLLELSALSQVLTRANVSIISGSFFVPESCLIMKEVYVNGYKLSVYEENDVPESVYGTPLFWYQDGANIKVYPAPSETTAAQVVYIKRETVMTEDDDTHTLTDADEFLIAFARWKVLVDTAGLSDEALYFKNEALEEKQKWLELSSAAKGKKPRKVRVGRWC